MEICSELREIRISGPKLTKFKGTAQRWANAAERKRDVPYRMLQDVNMKAEHDGGFSCGPLLLL
jgi:hypothetical protein